MQELLDLREIDLKLGPISKWNKEKLIEPPKKVYHSDIRLALSGDRTGKRYHINNTQNERLKQVTQKLVQEEINGMEPPTFTHAGLIKEFQYVEEKSFGQRPTTHKFEYPHPSNYESSESNYIEHWKKYYGSNPNFSIIREA